MQKLVHKAEGVLVPDDPFTVPGQKVQTKDNLHNRDGHVLRHHPGIITEKGAAKNAERKDGFIYVYWTVSALRESYHYGDKLGTAIAAERVEAVDEWARPGQPGF